MADWQYPIYGLFWALEGIWNIIVANWLLTVAITLLFVNYGVSTIKRTYKGKDEK